MIPLPKELTHLKKSAVIVEASDVDDALDKCEEAVSATAHPTEQGWFVCFLDFEAMALHAAMTSAIHAANKQKKGDALTKIERLVFGQ